MKITPLYKWLPVGSLIHGSRKYDPLKLMLHTVYAFGGMIVLATWCATGINTAEWNPIKQIRNNRETARCNQAYFESFNRLFGENGLADTDRSHTDSGKEISDCMQRMGVDVTKAEFMPCLEMGGCLVSTFRPTQSQLEKAIASYTR